MPATLTDELPAQRVRETVQFLRDRMTVVDDRAGWHNTFKPNRIGTTGAALPALFLAAAGEDLPRRDSVLNALRQPTFDDGVFAAWSILSLGQKQTANVEGTTWPLLALLALGETSDAELVMKTRSWLLSQQRTDGGWGSTSANPSRLTLTASSIRALRASGSAHDALARAAAWVRNAQRPQDGSWGATEDESGTVHHTCLAIQALLHAGATSTDDAIRRGRAYVLEHWNVAPRQLATEAYDVHFPNGEYQRSLLEHDPDALAVQTLLRLRGPGDLDRCFRAAHEVLGAGLTPFGGDVSLWNVLPRSFLALELLAELPSEGAEVQTRGDVVAYVSGRGKRGMKDLAVIAWQRAPIVPKRPEPVLIGIGLLVIAVLLVLLLLGKLELKEFLLGVILPVVLALYGVAKAK